jgi:hypothetical protein
LVGQSDYTAAGGTLSRFSWLISGLVCSLSDQWFFNGLQPNHLFALDVA